MLDYTGPSVAGDRAREQHGDAARVRRAVRRAQLGHGADRAAVRGRGRARLRLLRRQLQGLHHAGPATWTVSTYPVRPFVRLYPASDLMLRFKASFFLNMNLFSVIGTRYLNDE